jgi:hypothetical protein
MTHDEVRARLSALIDGALEAREAADVAAHLEGCAPCRAELAHLRATVTMLREVDPVQAPEGFAAAVRGRIEQLGPVRRPTWRRLRVPWPPTRWSWKTAAAAAAVAVVGIFAANLVRDAAPIGQRQVGFEGTPLARDGIAKTAVPRPASEPAPIGGAGDQARDRAVAQPSGDVPQFRRIIRTGHVAIEVETFDDAARRLLAIAEGAGGFIADSSSTAEGGVRRGTFVLRVPAPRFAEVLRQIEGLGTVQRRQVSGQDVTEEFVDLEARVRNLERQEARLLALVDRATKIPDLMAIESEVARVRGEIERLTGRLRVLAHQVELATIQAEVIQKAKTQPGGFWDVDQTIARIQQAFVATIRHLLAVLEGLAVVASALSPVALLGGLGWVAIRGWARRTNRVA